MLSVLGATALLATALTTALAAAPAQAATGRPGSVPTVPATGTFTFTTANGILPTWAAEDIVLIGVSPGSVVTAASNLSARVSVPIVAKTGSANAAAGGFRISNSATGASVRCSNPVIDTKARVIDCVLPGGRNEALFAITAIATRARVAGDSTLTWIFRGVALRINGQDMADLLNDELDTTTFSPYVTVGVGDLVVTRER
jgi:hypothetical protein